jgi:hypothetical protein
MMVAFSISIMFSSTVPMVTVAGCMFIFMRHFVDCFQLLTYFRKEIDSSGKIIKAICNTMMFFVLLYQVSMYAFFSAKKKTNESFICLAFSIFTVLYWAMYLSGNVFKLEDMEKTTTRQI